MPDENIQTDTGIGMPDIVINRLSKVYSTVHAVNGLSLRARRGEVGF